MKVEITNELTEWDRTVAKCWGICRRFDSHGEGRVLMELQDQFPDMGLESIAMLLIHTERIAASSSVPRGTVHWTS